MANVYIPEDSKSERISEKTDHSLIEAVQERSKLIELGCDEHHPTIRQGNRAFAELLNRYQRWLWKQIHPFTELDFNDAYSAALQGFEKAIAKFDLSRGYALVTFANVIVRNAIQKVLRKEKRQDEKAELAAVVAPLYHEDKGVDPYEQEQHEQQIESLNLEVQQLKPTPQKIVEMRESGMKFTEIGALCCRTADAVRMVFNRAFARLQKRLQPEPQMQIQPQPTLQTAEAVELTASVPAPIPEVENSTATPSESIPEQGWMGRLWSRFSKNVRFSNSRAISNSSILSPEENQDDLVLAQDSALKPDPLKWLSSIPIWKIFDE